MLAATIKLSLPTGLLHKVDREAKKEDRSRSELIRVAVQAYLDKVQIREKILLYGDQQAKKKKLKPSDVDAAIAEVRRT